VPTRYADILSDVDADAMFIGSHRFAVLFVRATMACRASATALQQICAADGWLSGKNASNRHR